MDKLTLYQALPYPLKSLLATVRGRQLRKWRYGCETERLVQEALERERWPIAKWQHWQQGQLAEFLDTTARHVPWYRQYWQGRRRIGDNASWELLENWPILDKEPIRENPQAFLVESCNVQRMFRSNTSGTSGKPLRLYQSRATLRLWYALCEARWRGWYGVSRANRWAIFGGQLVAPVQRRKPPFWVWNAAMNQLYASSYHMAPDLIPYYAEAIRTHRIEYLYGYSSSLYTLAQEVLTQNLALPKLRVVITNAEPLFQHQRRVMEQAFACPVRETYGISEMAGGASECEYGRMHFWSDSGVIEILERSLPVAAGTSGDVVLTGLVNRDMPLIRYRIRDRGSIAPPTEMCACGRTLPVLGSLDGRIDDVVYTSDGRRVGRLDPVFKGDLPVKEVQIVQEAYGQLRIIYVPAPGFDQAAMSSITERLRDRLGPIEVQFEAVQKIPVGPNGKFRAVISKIPSPDPALT
jgi:phenylacetate-CoA ligase